MMNVSDHKAATTELNGFLETLSTFVFTIAVLGTYLQNLYRWEVTNERLITFTI